MIKPFRSAVSCSSPPVVQVTEPSGGPRPETPSSSTNPSIPGLRRRVPHGNDTETSALPPRNHGLVLPQTAGSAHSPNASIGSEDSLGSSRYYSARLDPSHLGLSQFTPFPPEIETHIYSGGTGSSSDFGSAHSMPLSQTGSDHPPGLALQQPTQPTRSPKGIVNKLKRMLRIKPPVVQHTPFFNTQTISPTPARAPLDLTGVMRTHQEGVTAPRAAADKTASTTEVFAGKGSNTEGLSAAGQMLRDRTVAADQVKRMFPALVAPVPEGSLQLGHILVRNRAAEAPQRLTDRLLALAGEQDNHLVHTMSAACALEEVTGGHAHRALAALDVLSGEGETSSEAKIDAFALQRSLARTSLGFEALQALQPGLLQEHGDPMDGLIRQDAILQAFRAADHVMTRMPAGHPTPRNLQDVVRAARTMVRAELATQAQEATQPRHLRRSETAKPDLLAAKALMCAAELVADPTTIPDARLQSAYLAWRNGLTSEGKNSDLEKTQSRLFKLTTYARRASYPETDNFLRFMRKVVGQEKSPLSALPLGTAGARLRMPEGDFQTLNVVDTMVAHLNGQIKETMEAGDGSNDALRVAMPKAVRVAAACRYKELIGRKGWRDKVKVGSTMRKNIAKDAAQALGIEASKIRKLPEFKALTKIDAATLRAWAEEEGLPTAPGSDLAQQLDKLKKLDNNGDKVTKDTTPGEVLDTLRDVTAHARGTFDVRYTDGGIAGVSGSIPGIIEKAGKAVGVPVAVVGPDVKAIRGRQAIVSVGSTAHGGTLFVGTDTRISAHAGVGATAAWSLADDALSVTAGVQVLPFIQDRSAPQGVMIRTRMNNLGPAVPTGDPVDNEPWRGKLLEVFDTVTKSGPERQMPQDKDQMWDALAQNFFKDPDVSINWMEAKNVNTSSSITGSAGARYTDEDGYKVGPMFGLGFAKSWANKLNRKDTKGATKVQTIAHNSGSAVSVSAAVVTAVKPLGDFSNEPGQIGSVVLPNIPLVGVNVSLLSTTAGATLRVARDGDRIMPEVTFRDIEFANAQDHLDYIDSRNTAWAASAAPVRGENGQTELDTYLTNVKFNADRANVVYAERQRITPEAARQVDELEELRMRFTPSGQPPSPEKRGLIKGANDDIQKVMNDGDSWNNRFLFVMEGNGTQRNTGVGFLLQAQNQTDVNHLRMTAAIKANDVP